MYRFMVRYAAIGVLVAGLGLLLSAHPAAAQNAPELFADDVAEDPSIVHERIVLRNVSLAAHVGWTMGTLHHAEYVQQGYSAPFAELDIGYYISERWSVGVAAGVSSMLIDKLGRDRYARAGAAALSAPSHPVAYSDCSACVLTDGGGVTAKAFQVFTVGPRVEFMPLGQGGPFLGMMAGVGSLDVANHDDGFAFASRAGYRYSLNKYFSVGGALGLQSVLTKKSHASLPLAYAELSFR